MGADPLQPDQGQPEHGQPPYEAIVFDCDSTLSSVEGIDVLWIGHYDLTTSMGIPGQFEHPDYLAAVAALVEVCNKRNKALGQMVVSPEQGQPLLDQGFRTLAYGDIWTFESALKSGLDSLRS